jgi:hypothetical protein
MQVRETVSAGIFFLDEESKMKMNHFEAGHTRGRTESTEEDVQ